MEEQRTQTDLSALPEFKTHDEAVLYGDQLVALKLNVQETFTKRKAQIAAVGKLEDEQWAEYLAWKVRTTYFMRLIEKRFTELKAAKRKLWECDKGQVERREKAALYWAVRFYADGNADDGEKARATLREIDMAAVEDADTIGNR